MIVRVTGRWRWWVAGVVWGCGGCGDDIPSATGGETETAGGTVGAAETAGSGGSLGADTTAGAAAGDLAVFTTAELLPVLQPFVAHIPTEDIALVSADDPRAAAQAHDGLAIAVTGDGDDCDECYRLEGSAPAFTVTGGGVLGAQYGLGHAFEALGVRFFAPHSTFVPESWAAADALAFDAAELHAPEMAERGIQLHTLHPIEGLYAFWVAGDDHLAQAEVIADWCIKQRANLLQWVALEDIIEDPALGDAWNDHTAAILEHMHLRGLRAGVGVQLFGSGNLQRAFDLLDEDLDEAGQRAEMTSRYDVLLGSLPFDHVTLSFGEFSSVSPTKFLASADLAYEVLQEVAPGTTMSSVVHVGNYEHTYLDYMGETYLYYLLAQFADPAIVPWVHSVMYYNLYEDAGGAYLHDEFDLHRDLLLQRLRDGQDVGYFPETAYWVAFDNSVPTYLPVYIASRFVDFDRTRAAVARDGGDSLQRHVTFSSGFEWGYWQGDYAVLRMAWQTPAAWPDLVREMLAPLPGGDALADAVIAAADDQHQALIVDRLAAYMAGRDALIDVGDMGGGILSQPDRPSFEELAALTPAERQAFADTTIAGLVALADDHEAILAGLSDVPESPWLAEVVDGLEVDVLRARYVAAVFAAVLEAADGGDPAALLSDAEAHLQAAHTVVARRHAALWSPLGDVLLESEQNPTIYPNGYLQKANELCYWERELVQARQQIEGTDDLIPACYEFGGI